MNMTIPEDIGPTETIPDSTGTFQDSSGTFWGYGGPENCLSLSHQQMNCCRQKLTVISSAHMSLSDQVFLGKQTHSYPVSKST